MVMELTPEQRAAVAESISSDLPQSLNGLVIVQERADASRRIGLQ
jgi:hypothetical protein